MKRTVHINWTEWVCCGSCSHRFSVTVSSIYADAEANTTKYFFLTTCPKCKREVVIDPPENVQNFILKQI